MARPRVDYRKIQGRGHSHRVGGIATDRSCRPAASDRRAGDRESDSNAYNIAEDRPDVRR